MGREPIGSAVIVPTLRSKQETVVTPTDPTCKGRMPVESILTRIRAMFRIVRGCRSYRRLGLGLGLGIGEDYGARCGECACVFQRQRIGKAECRLGCNCSYGMP